MNILVVGKNSYIAKSFVNWASMNYPDVKIESISVRDDSWMGDDWKEYNCLVNFTGIAHQSEKKVNESEYFKINADLVDKLAHKAKTSGVKHFVQLSTMSVYGINKGNIHKGSHLQPNTKYGLSKLKGEELLLNYKDDNFKVSIIRPPMVYGPNCPGNYKKISNLIAKIPFFLSSDNERSMIFIDHLSQYIIEICKKEYDGLFHPQNKEYVKFNDLITFISDAQGNNLFLIKGISKLLVRTNLPLFTKMFCTLTYDKAIDETKIEFEQLTLKKTIYISERGI